jgi:hypothetical protein
LVDLELIAKATELVERLGFIEHVPLTPRTP